MNDIYETICSWVTANPIRDSLLTEPFYSFENRGHVFNVEQFEQVMAFENDEAMQKKWKAFCRKIDTKTDSYSTVLRTIRSFLRKPIVAVIDKKPFNEHWTAARNTWSLIDG